MRTLVLISVILTIVSCSEPVSPTTVYKSQGLRVDSGIAHLDTVVTPVDSNAGRIPRLHTVIDIYDDVIEMAQIDNESTSSTSTTKIEPFTHRWVVEFTKDGHVAGLYPKDTPHEEQHSDPFTMVDDYTVRVNEGSNATYLCRYYDIPMSSFLHLNPRVKNNDLIYAGETYKIHDCRCN